MDHGNIKRHIINKEGMQNKLVGKTKPTFAMESTLGQSLAELHGSSMCVPVVQKKSFFLSMQPYMLMLCN